MTYNVFGGTLNPTLLPQTHQCTFLMAIVSVEPELAGLPIDSPSPFVPDLCILSLSGQVKTFQILFNTIPPCTYHGMAGRERSGGKL